MAISKYRILADSASQWLCRKNNRSDWRDIVREKKLHDTRKKQIQDKRLPVPGVNLHALLADLSRTINWNPPLHFGPLECGANGKRCFFCLTSHLRVRHSLRKEACDLPSILLIDSYEVGDSFCHISLKAILAASLQMFLVARR